MSIENRFNLVDEPWIPVVGHGLASLSDIFSNSGLTALGGNPIQKIALLKLLLAIAQTAYTPNSDVEWKRLGADGMAEKCLKYLNDKKDLFWLYGKKPFLQMPKILILIHNRKEAELNSAKTSAKMKEAEEKALPKGIGSATIPDLMAENNTILTQNQYSEQLTDADKAIFIISLMNFALGGKRVEKNLASLSNGYVGKTNSAKSGPSLGNYVGYLHSFLLGSRIQESLYINLLTNEHIDENKLWENKIGCPPWERMPDGEDCEVAKSLKKSYMGCLVGLSRFIMLMDLGIYYVEGIQYHSHKQGWEEPSMAIDRMGKDAKVLWVNTEKKPWRNLTALLAFVSGLNIVGYDCKQICWTLSRAKEFENFFVWSGGLKVRGNAGDQSVKQEDDFVESEVQLHSSFFKKGSEFFALLKTEMEELENISKILYGRTIGFFKAQKLDGTQIAGQTTNLFWQLCERKFQKLVDTCAFYNSKEELKKMRKEFAGFINKAYNTYCPKDTARQLDAWAANKPNLSKYLA